MGKPSINWPRFAREMKSYRTRILGVGVRAAAKEAGVSTATLSRVENGKACDALTFVRLSYWRGMDINYYVKG